MDYLNKFIGLAFLVLISLCSPTQLVAQYGFSNPAHGTTYDWSFENRLQILDRSHAYGNYFYDRGYGRVITPLLNGEYELDMMTQEFLPGDQFAWHQNPNGVRTRAGSYRKTRLAVYSEVHTNSKFSDVSHVNTHVYLQQNARATRALLEIEYLHKLGDGHSIAALHTLTEYKQDLDVTLSYRYSNKSLGDFRFDFTYLDYLNNLVHTVGNDTNPLKIEEENYRFRYKSSPIFFYTRINAPSNNTVFWDISAGWQPKVRKVYNYRVDRDFRLEENSYIYFINGSLSFNFQNSTIGIYGYFDKNPTRRSSRDNPFDGHYKSIQHLKRFGIFYFGHYDWFQPYLRVSREYYYDQQEGTNFELSLINEPLDLRMKRWLGDIGIGIRPFKSNFRFLPRYHFLDHSFDDPEYQIMQSGWTEQNFTGVKFNHRITLSLLFNPHEKVYFEIGAAYDIDGDDYDNNPTVRRFDKGFTKILFKL